MFFFLYFLVKILFDMVKTKLNYSAMMMIIIIMIYVEAIEKLNFLVRLWLSFIQIYFCENFYPWAFFITKVALLFEGSKGENRLASFFLSLLCSVKEANVVFVESVGVWWFEPNSTLGLVCRQRISRILQYFGKYRATNKSRGDERAPMIRLISLGRSTAYF